MKYPDILLATQLHMCRYTQAHYFSSSKTLAEAARVEKEVAVRPYVARVIDICRYPAESRYLLIEAVSYLS